MNRQRENLLATCAGGQEHADSVDGRPAPKCPFFFFFNDTAPTEIYTLSLHDALPILLGRLSLLWYGAIVHEGDVGSADDRARSEEHTSELQSLTNLVCRLLLEKK